MRPSGERTAIERRAVPKVIVAHVESGAVATARKRPPFQRRERSMVEEGNVYVFIMTRIRSRTTTTNAFTFRLLCLKKNDLYPHALTFLRLPFSIARLLL